MSVILSCPFCASTLTREGGSLYCAAHRHCFDIAKSGYVTLTRAAGTSGDDREMVRARTAFLDRGYYRPFAEAIADAAANAEVVIDAGCGEGYYSNVIASRGAEVYGFDLSKHACDKAAKRAKAAGNGAFFGVASVFELPAADGCADAVVSLFAPIAEKEFARVLKPGGLLIVGAAGRRHLYELKQAIYSEVYENEGRCDLPSGFEQVTHNNVTYTFDCDGAELKSLFLMTPYAFKTSQSDAAKLDALSHLEITADFDIFVYKKK
ncbi:MAG: methyltransferase domain-containing protein [Clostridia bacterium]|nr:methyltransferase domain-containing protein [Clostridia bacterium]